jgi:hypothetical protein
MKESMGRLAAAGIVFAALLAGWLAATPPL